MKVHILALQSDSGISWVDVNMLLRFLLIVLSSYCFVHHLGYVYYHHHHHHRPHYYFVDPLKFELSIHFIPFDQLPLRDWLSPIAFELITL